LIVQIKLFSDLAKLLDILTKPCFLVYKLKKYNYYYAFSIGYEIDYITIINIAKIEKLKNIHYIYFIIFMLKCENF